MDAAAPPAGLAPAGLDDSAFDDEPILAEGDGSPANIGSQAGPPGVPADNQAGTDIEPEALGDQPILATEEDSPANIGCDRDTPGELPAPAHETAGSGHRQSDDEPILAEGRAPAPEQPPANIGTDEAEHDDIPDDAFESITPVAEDPANIGWRSRPRIERTGSLKAPDGKGAFWVWRWWELNGNGEKVRKSRYGGKVQTETARDYWAPATANIG